jgi:2-polyprenyl-3-methyl-5-hydroxy-6-metoxy-1,4-benzoquinol methylase
MNLRTYLCFALSRKLMPRPAERTLNYELYGDWRSTSRSRSWAAFSDSQVEGKDVLDFGCGDGQLSLFLAKEKRPRRVVGVDVVAQSVERAKASLATTRVPEGVHVDFLQSSMDKVPVPDKSFDTVIAFDCLEHVMAPCPILHDWYRILRPGGVA